MRKTDEVNAGLRAGESSASGRPEQPERSCILVMKKNISIVLSVILVLVSSLSAAESAAPADSEKLIGEYYASAGEKDGVFTVPVGVGIIYSVLIYKDSVGIVFSPVKNGKVAMGLQALDFLTDVKEIRLGFEDGKSAVFPASLEIKAYDVGTFIVLNLSAGTAASLSALVSAGSMPDKAVFVRSDGTEQTLTVADLNKALGSFFDGAVDIVNQVKDAFSVFWQNLSKGVSVFAKKTKASVQRALIVAGLYMFGTMTRLGQALDKAEEALRNGLDQTGDFVKDAADKAADFWKKLWDGQ